MIAICTATQTKFRENTGVNDKAVAPCLICSVEISTNNHRKCAVIKVKMICYHNNRGFKIQVERGIFIF